MTYKSDNMPLTPPPEHNTAMTEYINVLGKKNNKNNTIRAAFLILNYFCTEYNASVVFTHNDTRVNDDSIIKILDLKYKPCFICQDKIYNAKKTDKVICGEYVCSGCKKLVCAGCFKAKDKICQACYSKEEFEQIIDQMLTLHDVDRDSDNSDPIFIDTEDMHQQALDLLISNSQVIKERITQHSCEKFLLYFYMGKIFFQNLVKHKYQANDNDTYLNLSENSKPGDLNFDDESIKPGFNNSKVFRTALRVYITFILCGQGNEEKAVSYIKNTTQLPRLNIFSTSKSTFESFYNILGRRLSHADCNSMFHS